MRKGVLEFCILLIISKREVYASDIITKLKESQLLVVEGTLYPLLTRLKNDALLSYRWEESKSGPPRKYYTITESGTALLAEMKKIWNDMISVVDNLSENENQ